jgi:hypothetical protein
MGWIILMFVIAFFLYVAVTIIKFVYTDLIKNPINAVIDKCNKKQQYHEVLSSIGKSYETMCVLHPEEYEGDPHITKILEDYRKLLRGEILDEPMENAPSEILEDILNKDYLTYLKNQTKALKKAGKPSERMEQEYKRVKRAHKENDLLTDFRLALLDQDLPVQYLISATSHGRIQTYRKEDWEDLVKAVTDYDATYGYPCVALFLEKVEDKESLLDESKMEAFAKLIGLGVDSFMAASFVQDKMTEEDLQKVVEIMEARELSGNAALSLVLQEKKKELKKETLREQYENAVKHI